MKINIIFVCFFLQLPTTQRSGSISLPSGVSANSGARQVNPQAAQSGYSTGTLGRQSSSPYRQTAPQAAPPPVAPAPPSQYAPGMMGGGAVPMDRRSNYAPPSNYAPSNVAVPNTPQPSPYGVPQLQSNLPAPLPEGKKEHYQINVSLSNVNMNKNHRICGKNSGFYGQSL